ncbi:ATP phosphoribosyltransferase regulatory subunit [Inhella sp.]|uniref:ATP phosphoribosyltransferase regulatory subunit n=1 Tax=Inhella sp. TaxID=1921806 RepID=UPI0035B03158
MSSAWLLPEHFADVLPAQARRIEELRRQLLDLASCHGFELVMPPLVEHLDSLLSGNGEAQNLRTFKLVDQLSGLSLGVRADTTPQVARIDAHLLNRQGVTRLCYCGPVVHALPTHPLASREPLQFGVEVYGHAGLEADLEVLELALQALKQLGLPEPLVELSDARCARALLPVDVDSSVLHALRARNPEALAQAAAGLPYRDALCVLLDLEGGAEVLDRAAQCLPDLPSIQTALQDLKWLALQLQVAHPGLRLGVDLAAVAGNGYYTGVCFNAYVPGPNEALLRGGRYDEVGAAFGRRRPAVGFSLDLKNAVEALPPKALRAAIRAPWGEDAALRERVRELRAAGETVVWQLPGHEDEAEEYACDRELVRGTDNNPWTLRVL